jgi:hypothetical protein
MGQAVSKTSTKQGSREGASSAVVVRACNEDVAYVLGGHM